MAFFSLDGARFHGTKTNIKRPLEIAYYSHDYKGDYHSFSDCSLRYYCPPFFRTPHTPPPPSIDLSGGFPTFQKKDDSTDSHLDYLLATIEEHERKAEEKVDADFITWRGMMTKLVLALISPDDDFEMRATRYQGTIFIEEDHNAKLSRDARQHAQQSRPGGFSPEVMTYWGYKFETLALLDRPHGESTREEIESRPTLPVSNAAQYCSVVRTGLGFNSIVIGGEVDGVLGYKPSEPLDPPRWIELKTSRKPSSQRDYEFHSKKLLKFWAQSYLIGCPTIIIGYRTKDGFLFELEELQTQSIPKMVSNMFPGRWDAYACLSAASSFLDFLKANIDEGGVWRISRAKGDQGIRLVKDESEGTGGIVSEQFKRWRESPDCK